MVVAMIAVGGAALYVFWEDVTKPMPQPGQTSVMIYAGGADPMLDSPEAEEFDDETIFPPQTLDDMVQLHYGDETLEDEPANLSTPEQGQRLTGFRRSHPGHEQEVSVWLLKASKLAGAVEFYRRAAETQGFVPLPAPATGQVKSNTTSEDQAAPPSITLRYWLPPEDASRRMAGAGFGQLLTIRLSPQDQDIRATLTLIKPTT